MASSTPQRATRSAGKQTRQTLLHAADHVFRTEGETASVAQICERAGTFPNQVTYYFGSKEQLFVEVACAAVLRAGRHAEEAAEATPTVRDYAQTLVTTLLGPELRGVEMFTTAMLLVSRRDDLRELITTTLHTLHERGEKALMQKLVRTGWQLRASIDVEAKAFWSAIFGLAVQKSATDDSLGPSLTDAVTVIFTNLGISEEVLNARLGGLDKLDQRGRLDQREGLDQRGELDQRREQLDRREHLGPRGDRRKAAR
ncbi:MULTISPECIES: TetR/AcrR family transcriptional regulator C-terminal domain-containing protein [Gordonia]|uniref:TetR/AcrR family transcriptional regulator C-terminal domain-containing protein n=1 Tax=Gordonia TaxID=2053 RepID=UPI0007EB0D56|nr:MULTISPECIES: TetR/AcrR family transcriptional regulator C-terminal domain-containing protein [Gordonia]MCM3895849.1 TetR family transcriptional regulator [Gordonia sputi]OBA59589.1 TetR family transcriptional regulator [Gordonia sp. 852002-10350_SCH5691597]